MVGGHGRVHVMGGHGRGGMVGRGHGRMDHGRVDHGRGYGRGRG